MEKNPVKIILFGLNNSGKSSIALCLQRKNNLSYFTSLAPTRDHNIISFKDQKSNMRISIWDFGGQKRHRKQHLERLADEFSIGVSKLIYVIDIQDEERYELSLEYFQEILKELEKIKNNLRISVFLHKYDPNLEFNEQKITNLISKINGLIPKQFQHNIYKTSIYTIFSKKHINLSNSIFHR